MSKSAGSRDGYFFGLSSFPAIPSNRRSISLITSRTSASSTVQVAAGWGRIAEPLAELPGAGAVTGVPAGVPGGGTVCEPDAAEVVGVSEGAGTFGPEVTGTPAESIVPAGGTGVGDSGFLFHGSEQEAAMNANESTAIADFMLDGV